MRKPKPSDFDDGCGNIDWDEHDEMMGTYQDEEYDRYREERDEIEDEKDD